MEHPFCPNGANVVYQNSEGLIPVVQDIKTGMWQLPGGGVEAGESFEDTAVREFYEETGFVIFPDELVRIADFDQRVIHPRTGQIVDGTLRLFAIHLVWGEIRVGSNSEIKEARFMSPEEIVLNREKFNIAYVRLVLHYLRWRDGLTPVSFQGRLAEPIECLMPTAALAV